MIFDEETIYSKRYPSAEAELEEFSADTTMPVITPEQRETAYQKFRSSMNSEPYYEPIPGREKKHRNLLNRQRVFPRIMRSTLTLGSCPMQSKYVCIFIVRLGPRT